MSKRTAAAIAVAMCAPLMITTSAQASHGGGSGGVRASGSCTHGGTWALKAKHDSGVLELEFEVDVNRVGQHYAVRITDASTVVVNGHVRTSAPSGSFTVHARARNHVGVDTIRASATRGIRTCAGSVRI